MKNCHNRHCECEPGNCTHPGFTDARHLPPPLTSQEEVKKEAIKTLKGLIIDLEEGNELVSYEFNFKHQILPGSNLKTGKVIVELKLELKEPL